MIKFLCFFSFLFLLGLGASPSLQALTDHFEGKKKYRECTLQGEVRGDTVAYIKNGEDTWSGIASLHCVDQDDSQIDIYRTIITLRSLTTANGVPNTDRMFLVSMPISNPLGIDEIAPLSGIYQITVNKNKISSDDHHFKKNDWSFVAHHVSYPIIQLTILVADQKNGTSSSTELSKNSQSLDNGILELGELKQIKINDRSESSLSQSLSENRYLSVH